MSYQQAQSSYHHRTVEPIMCTPYGVVLLEQTNKCCFSTNLEHDLQQVHYFESGLIRANIHSALKALYIRPNNDWHVFCSEFGQCTMCRLLR